MAHYTYQQGRETVGFDTHVGWAVAYDGPDGNLRLFSPRELVSEKAAWNLVASILSNNSVGTLMQVHGPCAIGSYRPVLWEFYEHGDPFGPALAA